jgi:hypothetical protein
MEKLGLVLTILNSRHVDNDTAGQIICEIATNNWNL